MRLLPPLCLTLALLLAACIPAPVPSQPLPVDNPTGLPNPTSAAALPGTPLPAPETDYTPLSAEECDLIAAGLDARLPLPITQSQVPLVDPIGGQTGTACRLELRATGEDLPEGLGTGTLLNDYLLETGWLESIDHAAAGPTGSSAAYHRLEDFALLNVGWEPAPGLTCPADRPIAECGLTPAQMHYTLTLDLARRTADYRPLPDVACRALRDTVAFALGFEAVEQSEAPFEDPFTGIKGAACHIQAAGSGLDFPLGLAEIGPLLTALENAGWRSDIFYAADGPTGSLAGLRQPGALLILRSEMTLAPGVTCPPDQPIVACDLAPEQVIYTFTLDAVR